MKVYIAQTGVYEDVSVGGVYDTPERAMAAHDAPDTIWTKTTWAGGYVSWTNNHDLDQAVRITEYDLADSGPEREPDRRLVQTYRESDGAWDYVPE